MYTLRPARLKISILYVKVLSDAKAFLNELGGGGVWGEQKQKNRFTSNGI